MIYIFAAIFLRKSLLLLLKKNPIKKKHNQTKVTWDEPR